MTHRGQQRESGAVLTTDNVRENAGAGSALTAKEYLMQYRESMERTAEIEMHLHELKAEAIRLKDHEGQSVKLDAAVAQYVDACNAKESELNRLAALRGEIEGTIDSVPDPKLRSLLHWRYICGFSWEQVAVKMNYSWRRVLQLHGTALHIVAECMDNTE